MTLEIVKEEAYGEPTWYFVRVDGSSIKCSKNLEEMVEFYDELKNNPELVKPKKTILKSDEI